MLTKLIKNFFAACYLGLAKSAKQMRKICCIMLCLTMTLELISAPTQITYAETRKVSGWPAAPGTTSDVARVPHPWGDYAYLRVISIKEAQSWGMDTVLTIKDLPGAYAVQSPASPIPDNTKYYPIKYSRIETDENDKKILVDDDGYSIPVGTKLFTAQGVAHSQLRLATMSQILYLGTEEGSRYVINQDMKTDVAGIIPYRSAKKVTKPTLNAIVGERCFIEASYYLNANDGSDKVTVDNLKYSHDNKQSTFMPLTPGANSTVQLDIDCNNDCKTKDAKGVRLKVTYPKTVKKGEVACFTVTFTGKNLSQSPVVNEIYAIATADAKLTLLLMDVDGTHSEFPKRYKSFAKKAVSKNGVLIGCDQYVFMDGDGTVPAGMTTNASISFKVFPLK